MAVTSVCAALMNGIDLSCVSPDKRFFQQAVLINKTDIDPDSVVITLPVFGETPACNYKVAFSLLTGKTGYMFKGPEAGSSFFGKYDKTRSALGHPQYKHGVQVLLAGTSEEAMCVADAIDKGSFVVALQLTSGTVVIYGMTNGLTTGDYTYSIQENGGGAPIMLASLDTAPENNLPLIYESAIPGQENTDFNALFATP